MSDAKKIDVTQMHEGDLVDTAEEETLGHVIAFWPDMITPTHLVVEGGHLLHHDWYIPVTAIGAYLVSDRNDEPGRVVLSVGHTHVDVSGWNEPPPGAPPARELIGE